MNIDAKTKKTIRTIMNCSNAIPDISGYFDRIIMSRTIATKVAIAKSEVTYFMASANVEISGC